MAKGVRGLLKSACLRVILSLGMVLAGLLTGSPASTPVGWSNECLRLQTVQNLSFPGNAEDGYFVNVMLWADPSSFPDDGVGVEEVQVDTGADGTLLPKVVADELGLDLLSGRRIPVRGVFGGKGTIREHSLMLAVVSRVFPPNPCAVNVYINRKPVRLVGPFPVDVGFPEDDIEVSKLLGRQGLLDHLRIIFTPEEVRFEVIKD